MLGLLNGAPLVSNVNDLRSTGQVRRKIEPNTGQPYWVMDVYTHTAVTTVGTPYAIYWLAKRPTTAAVATGFEPLVGIATETLAAVGWTEMIVAGYAYQIVSTGAIPAGSGVEVLTTASAVIDDGADAPLIISQTLGHAQAAASNNLVDVWLYGRIYVEIKSS